MKLIDILVQELPKRGGFPEGAKTVAQDSCGECWGFDCCNPKIKNGLWWVSDSGTDLIASSKVQLDLLADDWSSTFITREQYEAALAGKNDGWIEWGGGECPVPRGTLVDVRYRDGNENHQVGAGAPFDDTGSNPDRNAADWQNDDSPLDIIAYRLRNPQEVTEADDEADLNECIGQAPELVWNGEGLPPIGCECERSWCGDNWLACTVLFLSAETVVVKLATKEAAYGVSEVKFRPIRSEADKKRDEAKHTIAELCRSASSNGHAADLIYDAISAGKVRGVNMED